MKELDPFRSGTIYTTSINIGVEGKKDNRIIGLRLRKIPLFYRALLNGINPADIIFVECSLLGDTSEVLRPQLLRHLTVELPAFLKETTMNNNYHTTGVSYSDFKKYCEGGSTEEYSGYLEDFKHFIQPVVSKIDGEMEIPVYVYFDNRMHIITPPLMPADFGIDDLADYIARRWGKWDSSNGP